MKMNSEKLENIRLRNQEKSLKINGVKEENHNLNNKNSVSTDNSHSKERRHMNDKNLFNLKKNEEKVENINEDEIKMSKYNNNNKQDLYKDEKKLSKKHGLLPDKSFQIRNSLLTDLFNEVKHIKAVYNAFAAILIILILNTAANDLLGTESSSFGLSIIRQGFGKLSYVIKIWLSMIASSFVLYHAYRFWAYQRIQLTPKSHYVRAWDQAWLVLFVIYQMTFIILSAQVVAYHKLPPPSSFIILLEQARLVMKIHAFVRSTVPTILSYKPHTDKKLKFPEVSVFSYFLFAPTLIYRDNYPRTKEIRWGFVASHFFEVILVIFYVAFMFERFVLSVYKDFGNQPMNFQELMLNIFFNTTLPGSIIFLCGFYCLQHAWMNAFAEMMRFGDRLFYKDWWNSGSYDRFYRTWNVVVQDWLYTYVYKDIYEIIAPGNKFLASFTVFFISGVFHEYILSYAFRFVYPVMFTLFVIIGYTFIFFNKNNTSKFGNIFIWFSLSTGSGIMMSCYTMEYFARINCPGHNNEIVDIFLPRSWFCYKGNESN